MNRRLLPAATAAVAAALLLTVPNAPRSALGQTIPLRPTPTLPGGSVSVLPQPTPPVPPASAAPPPPTRPAVIATQTAAPVSPPSATPTVAAARAPVTVEHFVGGLPGAPPGWRLAESAYRVTGAPPAGEAGNIVMTFSARDLAAAGGAASNLALFSLDSNGAWTHVVGQALDSAVGRLTYRPAGSGLYAALARNLVPDGDYDVAGGRFFRTAGAGAVGGFSVLDGAGGARSAFWTVYAAAGGEASLGRPVSRRFVSGEQLVQHFERGIVFSDTRTNATARQGAPASPAPPAAREPEPPPLPA